MRLWRLAGRHVRATLGVRSRAAPAPSAYLSITTTTTRSPPILARAARMAGSWPRNSIQDEHRAEAHSRPEGRDRLRLPDGLSRRQRRRGRGRRGRRGNPGRADAAQRPVG